MTNVNHRKAADAKSISEAGSSAGDHAGGCCGSRRHFLTGMAALGAAAMVPMDSADAQQQATATKGGIVDVHHHMYSPKYLEKAKTVGYGSSTMTGWTPNASLEDMDRNGVKTSILSVSSPGVWFGNTEEDRGITREVNEYGARLQSDQAGRFGHFASIPLPDTDGCLREIEYAFDTLKADGICLMTNYGDKLPGDPAFAPVFEELNRRKAIVFFHPMAPTYCSIKFADMTPTLLEYPFDTARAITSLLYSGTFSRRPDIRFIFSHGGGATPMVAYRINHTARTNKEVAARLPNGSDYELKKLYYETAQASNPVAIAALLKMVSSKQVLFGSDTPYWTSAPFIQELHTQGLSDADLANIEHDTAYRLITRLKS